MDQQSNVSDRETLARQLQVCVRSQDLAHARELVGDLSGEERRRLTRQAIIDPDPERERGTTLLCEAVWKRSPSFVSFLLDECLADVNQRCQFFTRAPNLSPVHLSCVPCCMAEDEKNTDLVVSVLVDHGADINAADGDQLTPVNTACKYNMIDVVKYLVEHGADIGIPDDDGRTCLMNSMRGGTGNRCALWQYLIEQGASVNAVDNFGNTTLHWAVRSGRDGLRLVTDLLQRGADPTIRNQFGDDVLQHAALHGCSVMLEHTIRELQPAGRRRADLYALFAAQVIDPEDLEGEDVELAMKFWKKAVSTPRQIPQDESTTGGSDISRDRHPVYGVAEARRKRSLAAIEHDDDAVMMQALVCRERVLGRYHTETILRVFRQAACYVQASDDDDDAYHRAIEMYRYAAESCSLSPVHAIWNVAPHESFCSMLREKHEEDGGSVNFDDAADMIRLLVADIRKPIPVTGSTVRDYIKPGILALSVDVLDLLCRLTSSDAESLTLKQLARDLVTSADQQNYGSLLHRAVKPASFGVVPNSDVVAELLEAGADVNAVNSCRDTPLLVAVKRSSEASRRDALLRVIDLLLQHGAHIDVRNARGETAVDRMPPTVDLMQHTTLQCLAARTVRKHGIRYRHVRPASVAAFVELH